MSSHNRLDESGEITVTVPEEHGAVRDNIDQALEEITQSPTELAEELAADVAQMDE